MTRTPASGTIARIADILELMSRLILRALVRSRTRLAPESTYHALANQRCSGLAAVFAFQHLPSAFAIAFCVSQSQHFAPS